MGIIVADSCTCFLLLFIFRANEMTLLPNIEVNNSTYTHHRMRKLNYTHFIITFIDPCFLLLECCITLQTLLRMRNNQSRILITAAAAVYQLSSFPLELKNISLIDSCWLLHYFGFQTNITINVITSIKNNYSIRFKMIKIL